eukprot:1040322-Amphidinium_carterae.1
MCCTVWLKLSRMNAVMLKLSSGISTSIGRLAQRFMGDCAALFKLRKKVARVLIVLFLLVSHG